MVSTRDNSATTEIRTQPAPAFTPGPWEAALVADSYEQRSVYGPNNEHITYVVNGSAIPGRTTANARLIAAAPDLLEALRPFADMDFLIVGGGSEAVIAMCDRARDALNKAEGK